MLKLKREKTDNDSSIQYGVYHNNKRIGFVPMQLMWHETCNIHLDLVRGILTGKQVSKTFKHAMRLAYQALGYKHFVAWIPKDNKEACHAIVNTGFERYGANPDLNFYKYTLEI